MISLSSSSRSGPARLRQPQACCDERRRPRARAALLPTRPCGCARGWPRCVLFFCAFARSLDIFCHSRFLTLARFFLVSAGAATSPRAECCCRAGRATAAATGHAARATAASQKARRQGAAAPHAHARAASVRRDKLSDHDLYYDALSADVGLSAGANVHEGGNGPALPPLLQELAIMSGSAVLHAGFSTLVLL